MVKILLLKSFQKLGLVGQIVNVKPGYAKNFLVPSGIALFANKNIISQFENRKSQLEQLDIDNKIFAENIVTSLNDVEVSMIKKSFTDGKLFGSISTKEVYLSLFDYIVNNISSIDRGKLAKFITPASVRLFDHIKYVGRYSGKVVLYGQIMLDFDIDVKSQNVE